jgi:hypothetical protein|tara:strand:- start:549 stop:944 length:396 start_codon:yes stop_codon:yes gene_type:complete
VNESELFYKFKANYLPQLKVAIDTYSPFDAICHEAKVVVEFKCRRSHYSDMLIEWPKYETLLNRAADRGYKPIYVCSTPLGVWAWDLTYLQLKWIKKALPKQTDFSNNNTVVKQVAYISLEDGSYLSKIEI